MGGGTKESYDQFCVSLLSGRDGMQRGGDDDDTVRNEHKLDAEHEAHLTRVTTSLRAKEFNERTNEPRPTKRDMILYGKRVEDA